MSSSDQPVGKNTPDPFTDTAHPPSQNSSSDASVNSSCNVSRPGSSGGERRGNQRVRFGSGEALDELNNRTAFNLTPSLDSSPPSRARRSLGPPIKLTTPPSSTADRQDYFVYDPIDGETADITEARSRPSLPPLSMPPRAFSFTAGKNDEELELNEKYDQFREHLQSPPRMPNLESYSAPSSAHTSPTLNAFSVGAGQAQGPVPVDDIPLLDVGGKASSPQPAQNDQAPTRASVQEASELVRYHSRRHAPPVRGSQAAPPLPQLAPVEHIPGTQTPMPQKHADYVAPPEQYRGGVLSSLLKLYNTPAQQPQHSPVGHSHEHFRNVSTSSAFSDSGLRSPGSSGRTTPKWYSKSANASSSSLGNLLAASGSALMAPAAGTSAQKNRPRIKHRPHSSGGLSAFKRPNLEEEIKITVHIAGTLARQQYILKLCRALMLYGAPTHRLEEALKMTARVLEIDGQFLYVPGCMIVSFNDQSTHTSEMRLVKTAQGVDLGKLHDTHIVYKEVVHDIISAEKATETLEEIMKRKPKHKPYYLIPVYGIASASVGPFGFSARPIDMPILFILGCLLGFLQLVVAPSSELYANVFEISAAILTSFLARAFGSIKGGSVFCFSALAQASIALILPGYIILCGSLELQSKNLVAGSVRMFYAVIYSLFLGFGITIGSALYGLFDSKATSATKCDNPLDWRWNFLFMPFFALCLMVVNQARWRQTPIMMLIAVGGYVVNYFSSKKFSTQPQVANALGAFVIGVMGNVYSRIGHGLAFAAMLPAIFVQVPSGLAAEGSLIAGVRAADSLMGNSTATEASDDYDSAILDVGFSMIQVAIGITVGLFAAALVVYPFGKRRSGLFSF